MHKYMAVDMYFVCFRSDFTVLLRLSHPNDLCVTLWWTLCGIDTGMAMPQAGRLNDFLGYVRKGRPGVTGCLRRMREYFASPSGSFFIVPDDSL